MDLTILLGVGMFTTTVLFLVAVILLARTWLVSSGEVLIEINEDPEKSVKVAAGGKLLSTLADQGIFLASACGGGGTCSQCRCRVLEGGGGILSTEQTHFNRREVQENWRLSCQVVVKQNLKIEIPDDAIGVQRWQCEVISNRNVATFIKELNLRLPLGEEVDFRAGGYVQLEIPPYEMDYSGIDVEPEYRPDWDRFDVWKYHSKTLDQTVRAYSMANYPEEKGILKFNIRIATPPPGMDVPPGAMSSHVFNLKPGDRLTTFGPYGEFFVKDTDAEKVWIGGGAGMAPLRSQIFDELKRRGRRSKMSYWYGARSLREMFYVDEFDALARDFSNFEWHAALSDPLPEDQFKGHIGFIHQVVYDQYLGQHPNPEDCEYYLCGPPPMVGAVLQMLEDFGVEPENIRLDDFGS